MTRTFIRHFILGILFYLSSFDSVFNLSIVLTTCYCNFLYIKIRYTSFSISFLIRMFHLCAFHVFLYLTRIFYVTDNILYVTYPNESSNLLHLFYHLNFCIVIFNTFPFPFLKFFFDFFIISFRSSSLVTFLKFNSQSFLYPLTLL